jgi:gas vesicle protein
MEWSKILTGVLVGAVLGVSATLYTLNERLVRVESKLEMLEQNDRKIETVQQNLGNRLQVLEQEKRQSSNPVSSLSTTKKKRVLLHEPFDSNVLGWGLGEWSKPKDNYYHKGYIANGKYHFKIQMGNHSIDHRIIELTSLPLNYDIELVSQWQSGDKDEAYGLFLGNDDDNFYTFGITHSGYAQVWLWKKGKWKYPINPIGGFSNQSSRYTKQLIKVRADEFSYYVNEKLVGKGYIGEVGLGKIGLSVTASQEIAFDRLSIFENN